MTFLAHLPSGDILPVDLALAGEHNVLNALAAIAIADKVGVGYQSIRESLAGFEGIGRRFEILGELPVQGGSAVLVDDYAHHPREIEATLAAARGCWPDRRLVVVFQPHRYTRTGYLFNEFTDLLSAETCLIIAEVYAAGEAPIEGISRDALVDGLRRHGHRNAVPLPSPEHLAATICDLAGEGDLILCMGAGSISSWAQSLPGEIEFLTDGPGLDSAAGGSTSTGATS